MGGVGIEIEQRRPLKCMMVEYVANLPKAEIFDAGTATGR